MPAFGSRAGREEAAVYMPAIVGDTWLNTQPLAPEQMRDRVVLVDFWTYSCVNCLRTLPHLRSWWDKYSELAFLLIGVHAPEFEFEKEVDNVAVACRQYGVTWPVVLDNRYLNWHNFANRYWPAKYLADPGGRIIYRHFGEGAYVETERRIQELLLKLSPGRPLPPLDRPLEKERCVRATPETYCGYVRGRIANPGGYVRNVESAYARPASLEPDALALSGKFIAEPQYVEAAEPGAGLLLDFSATEVNLVMRAAAGDATAEVRLNGEVPPADYLGSDVDPAGRLSVREPRMYNLLRADRVLAGVLSVAAVNGRPRAYAFTFSGCLEPVL